MAGVLIGKEEHRETYRGKRPCKDKGRDWSDTDISQGMPRITRCHQNLGRGTEGFFSRAFTGSMVLPIRISDFYFPEV